MDVWGGLGVEGHPGVFPRRLRKLNQAPFSVSGVSWNPGNKKRSKHMFGFESILASVLSGMQGSILSTILAFFTGLLQSLIPGT